MLRKIDDFKNKRNMLLFLSSYMSSSLSLEKAQDSFNLPYTKEMNIIIPYCSNKIDKPFYVKEEDLHLLDDKENVFFIKSFLSKSPKNITLNKVWIKLVNKASINTEDYYDRDCIKAEAVSIFEETFDLKKSTPVKRGAFILDTSDIVPYIKTAVFRLLKDLVQGMNNNESRELELPVLLNQNTKSEYKVEITKKADNVYNYTIINTTTNEIISGGPVILPKIAEAIINIIGWYDQLDDNIIPEWFMQNKELLQGIQQILLDFKNSFAINSFDSILKEIKDSPNLSTEEIKNILAEIKTLKEDVLGIKNKVNSLADLSDKEIDNINNIIKNIQDTLSNSKTNKIINISVS